MKSGNENGRQQHRIRNNIFIDHEMFYSEAFQGLSKSALFTLLRCLQKRKFEKKRDPGSSHKRIVYLNEGFIFPYEEAAFLGIRTTAHWQNIRVLIERGFLDIVHQGGWYQKHETRKDYSIYKLSDRWRLYGKDGFQKVEKPKTLLPEYHIRRNLEKKSL